MKCKNFNVSYLFLSPEHKKAKNAIFWWPRFTSEGVSRILWDSHFKGFFHENMRNSFLKTDF